MSDTTPAFVFATASYYDLVIRLLTAVTHSPITDLYYESTPRLSEADYIRMIQLFAPDRDVREVDEELTTLYRTYIETLERNLNALSVRVLRQTEIFRLFISNYDLEFPNGQTDADSNQLPEPELIATSRLGLRIARALDLYMVDMIMGPRDFRRTKLTYLLVQALVETGVPNGLELPTPLESICEAFARFNLTNDFGWTTSYSNAPAYSASHQTDSEMNSTDDDADTTDSDADTTDDDVDSTDSNIGPTENTTAE
ncbi:hypothetical protein FRC10_005866 [Ceratobasidium sp. 414]|nr:hypothetical protein FRC10_005866 [Ceratobasidium sp. 414]